MEVTYPLGSGNLLLNQEISILFTILLYIIFVIFLTLKINRFLLLLLYVYLSCICVSIQCKIYNLILHYFPRRQIILFSLLLSAF